jgi:putative endonuclease
MKTVTTVYILQSLQDNSYYIGSTKNIYNRINEHNSGKSTYTAKKRPWKIVYVRKYICLKDATREEKRLKKCRNKKYFNWLIDRWSASSIGRATPS